MSKYSAMIEEIKNSSAAELDGTSQIELIGNKRAVIDTPKRVIEYTREKLKLDLGEVKMSICGNNMVVRTYSNDKIIVDGLIMSVNFSS